MQNIKALIFDIGGVVTFTDFQSLYANFANRIGISPEFVRQYHKENWENLLLGVISLEQFFKDMKNAGANEGLDLKTIWLEEGLKIQKVNTELLDIIAKLKKHYTIGVLSNLTPPRIMLDEYMNIYNNFDFVILSCKVNLKKSDSRFYQLAVKRTGAMPSQIVFIDDMERNIIAAGNCGMKSVIYTDNKNLEND